MGRKLGNARLEPADRVPDPPGHGFTGALGVVRELSGPPADPGDPADLGEELVALRLEQLDPPQVRVVVRLYELVVELGAPAAVGLEGLPIREIARSAGSVGHAVQVEDVDVVGRADEP